MALGASLYESHAVSCGHFSTALVPLGLVLVAGGLLFKPVEYEKKYHCSGVPGTGCAYEGLITISLVDFD